MSAPAVSGAQTYPELCLAAKNEERHYWNWQNVSNIFQEVSSTVIITQEKSMHNLLPIDQVPSHSLLLIEGDTFATAQIT